jgi:hypothetical protein
MSARAANTVEGKILTLINLGSSFFQAYIHPSVAKQLAEKLECETRG